MKGKALALLLATLVAGTAFALESGPSNPVGFFTVTVSRAAGAVGYNLISFPTIPTDSTLANTIGGQVPGNAISGQATQLQYFNNGTNAYQSVYKNGTATGWSGTAFTTLEARKGYFLLLRSNTPLLSYNIVVAGNVRTSTWDMGTIGVGYNMIGTVFAAPVTISSSNIVSGTNRFRGGFPSGNSDQIQYFTGSSTQTVWLNSNTSTWSGPFTTLDPGKGYWILRRSGRTPATFAWNDLPVPTGGSTDSYTGFGSTVKATPVAPTFDIAAPAVSNVKTTNASMDAAAPVKTKGNALQPKSK